MSGQLGQQFGLAVACLALLVSLWKTAGLHRHVQHTSHRLSQANFAMLTDFTEPDQDHPVALQPTAPPPEATHHLPPLGGEVEVVRTGLGSALLSSQWQAFVADMSPEWASAYPNDLRGRTGCTVPGGRAYVTLITHNTYLPGVLTLARALREVGAAYPLVVMATATSLSVGVLASLWAEPHTRLCLVDFVTNPRPGSYFDDTYNKLNAFAMPLDTLVFLDADTLPLQSLDDLFDRLQGDERFAGCCDCAWRKAMNTGLMVLRPHTIDFADMIAAVEDTKSLDSGDQGFINAYLFQGRECLSESTKEVGFVRLAKTDEWERGHVCYKSNLSPGYEFLQKWLAAKDYSSIEDEQAREMQAIMDNLGEIRLIHFQGSGKVWQLCHVAETCTTGKGRTAALDRLYFEAMERYGVFRDGLARVGTLAVFQAADLSPKLIAYKCGKYEEDMKKDGYPQYHTAAECTGSGIEQSDELGASLANLMFTTCDPAGCVFSLNTPTTKAWRWDKGRQCWQAASGCLDTKLDFRKFALARMEAMVSATTFGSALFALPVRDLLARVAGHLGHGA